MPKRTLILLSLLSIASASPAQRSGYGKLTGEFTIAGKELLDPPPGQKNDRLALFLGGESAKRAYQAMPGRAIKEDACEEGLRVKTAGGLACWHDAAMVYQCSVGILLSTGQTRRVDVC